MALSRSEQMARITGQHTQPERVLRSILWRRGLRYRLHFPTPGGRADIVFLGNKVAVYVDGCFWHGCLKHYVLPRSNREFWLKKLRTNVERDIRQITQLLAAGWHIVRVLEHEVFENVPDVVSRVEAQLADPTQPEIQWRVISAEPVEGDPLHERWECINIYRPEERQVIVRRRTTTKWKKGRTEGGPRR